MNEFGGHTEYEVCAWLISAPEDANNLKLICNVDTVSTSGCEAVFISYAEGNKLESFCGKTTIEKTINAQKTSIIFLSSAYHLHPNSQYKGFDCTISYE